MHIEFARVVVDQWVVNFALEGDAWRVFREVTRELHCEFEFGLFVEALAHQDHAVPDYVTTTLTVDVVQLRNHVHPEQRPVQLQQLVLEQDGDFLALLIADLGPVAFAGD